MAHKPNRIGSRGPFHWHIRGDTATVVPPNVVLQENGIYFPSKAADFVTLGIPTPTSLWKMAETGTPSSLADSIGPYPLAVSGTPLTQQAVAGFSLVTGFTPGDAAVSTSAPPLPTTSKLLMALVELPVGSTTAPVMSLGTNLRLLKKNTGGFEFNVNGSATESAIDGTGVQFMAFGVNTPLEEIQLIASFGSVMPGDVAYSGLVTGSMVGLGQPGTAISPFKFIRAWFYEGTAAEMTAFDIQNISGLLGFGVG